MPFKYETVDKVPDPIDEERLAMIADLEAGKILKIDLQDSNTNSVRTQIYAYLKPLRVTTKVVEGFLYVSKDGQNS